MQPVIVRTEDTLQKVVTFHDLNDGRFAVDTTFDVQEVVDSAQDLRNAAPPTWKGDLHLVASIPMPIYQALLATWRALGLSKEDRQAALKRFLHDPDNAKFRTKTGRL